MGAKKRRHHYVPRVYLQGFVDADNPSCLWAYDKQEGVIVQTSPRDAALEKHYYSFMNAQGVRDSNTLEDALQKIDDESAPALLTVRRGAVLADEDRRRLARFMAISSRGCR